MEIFSILSKGGQTWAHRIRMLRQVFKIIGAVCLAVSLFIFVSLMFNLHFFFYESAYYYIKANTIGVFTPEIAVNSSFWEAVSNQHSYSDYVLVSSEKVSQITERYVDLFLDQSMQFINVTTKVSFYTMLAIISFFLLRGFLSKRKKHISGRKLASAWWLALRLKLTRRASPIRVGHLPLLKGSEVQHIMITGGTGSGKSNCMHHILKDIRANNQRAVIVDTTGVFVDRYFIEGKDKLLNPLDPRGELWSPWAECHDSIDMDDIAECFIPSSYSEHENYWRTAGRVLFSSLMQKCETTKRTSELSRWILFEPLKNLCEYIQGTKGAAHLDMNSERTAVSIRSVTSSFLSSLEFLRDTYNPFSIKEWMKQENDKGWLFLSCTQAQRASLRPLLSCWFSIATRSLSQLSPDFNRRIWFVVDELPSLNKLKDLDFFLAESRKYGGCAMIALQSISQLESIYGRDVTKTIVGNCATKIAFSEQDPEICDRISKAFGEREIKEWQESISYGSYDARDGVNLSNQAKIIPLVSSTDIQSLKRNQAFVKLPENLPITKVKLKICKSVLR